MSMMGTSKYEFEPEKFEEDVKDKRRVMEVFKRELKDVLYREYRYSNNQPMSKSVKRELLLGVHKEFIGDD